MMMSLQKYIVVADFFTSFEFNIRPWKSLVKSEGVWQGLVQKVI